MTYFQKQKLKSRLMILVFGILGIFTAVMSDANAFGTSFTTDGCTAAGCHDGGSGGALMTGNTCNACHAHGSHSDSGKNDLNVTAITDASSYNVGDTIEITVTSGYKNGWARINVYDDSGALVAQSKGACDSTVSSGSACAEGEHMVSTGIKLTATASSTGTQMWTASWYGNSNDTGGSAGGDNAMVNSSGVTVPGWLPDSGNSGHGEEIVAIAAFTVNEAAAGGGAGGGSNNNTNTSTTTSDGGGGSMSGIVFLFLLFVYITILVRDRKTLTNPK